MSAGHRSHLTIRLLAAVCVLVSVSALYIPQGRTLSRSEMFLLYEKVLRMEPKVEDVQYTLTQIDSRFSELLTRMDTLFTKIDTQQTQLDSQQTQLDSQQTQLDSLQSQLTALMDTSQNKQSWLDGAATETASQQTQMTDRQTGRPTDRLDQLEQTTCPTPRDCSELPAGATTGVHLLRPGLGRSQSKVEAFCDMDTDGGRWTVFQRRDDIQPRQDFYLKWTDYDQGFGNLTEEFWWGLHYLWQLTSANDRQYELRIDLEDFDGNTAHAVYQDFSISSEEDRYRLSVSTYTGDAGDSLRDNVGWSFSTQDMDWDDRFWDNCADKHQGAWWYRDCSRSNLNGRYGQRSGDDGWSGIYWHSWKRFKSLKKTEMKIRPT